jgi:hypothetical protein
VKICPEKKGRAPFPMGGPSVSETGANLHMGIRKEVERRETLLLRTAGLPLILLWWLLWSPNDSMVENHAEKTHAAQ